MRVGTVCYATDQGLGILARSFHDHGVVTDFLVVEHSSHPTHREWYPRSPVTKHRPFDEKLAKDFCASMDVMLFFETPFLWDLVPHCREHGVRTVMIPMHECSLENPPHRFDLVIAPSHLDHDAFPGSTFIPVPVEVPWRLRQRADVFVYTAGHGGLKGRNGTKELLESLQYVRSPVNLVVRSQRPIDLTGVNRGKVNLEVRVGTVPHEDLWTEGDVFVFPEAFNGLSLPLQESRAAGMLVMCGDRFPMNRWLPTGPMIPVQRYTKERIGPPYLEYDRAHYDPLSIAMTIDQWAFSDVSEYSVEGRDWARSMSWERLKPRYMEILESCA